MNDDLSAISNEVFSNDISATSITRWLNQFTDDERDLATLLLRKFRYFNYTSISAKLIELHQKLRDSYGENLVFISVGHSAKSGDLVGYFFRKENHLPSDNFERFEDLRTLARFEGKVLVFLDDFSGSGRQAERLWQSIRTQLNEEPKAKFVYATIIALSRARKRLESNSLLDLVTVEELGSEQMPFSDDSVIVGDASARERLKNLALKYGARVYPSHPLGYSESACLIGFFYSTPNNTLPIFWSKKNDWFPLLPHSEPLRDRPFIIGANPSWLDNTVHGSTGGIQKDEEDTIALATMILNEFKSLRAVNTLLPIFTGLRLQSNVTKILVELARELSLAQNEGVAVATSILVPHSSAAVSIVIRPREPFKINSKDKLRSLARGVDGHVAAVVVNDQGIAQGISFFPNAADGRVSGIPSRLHRAAEMSRLTKSLLILSAGDGRADVLFDGYLLLSLRNGKWHHLDPSVSQSILLLGRTHSLSGEGFMDIVRMCMQISDDRRGGAFICFGDAASVLKHADPDSGCEIPAQIGETPEDILVGIFRQDGATIISNAGRIERTMSTIRPPKDVKNARLLPGKGTKHQTAAVLSALTESLCIAVSADGPITFFSKGEPVLRLFA